MFAYSLLGRAAIPLLGIAGYLSFTSATFAQERVATLDDMRERSSSGDRVVLVKTNGNTVSGELVRIGVDDIEIRTQVEITQQRHQVINVIVPHEMVQSFDRKRMSGSKGKYIGAGVGAGFALSLFGVAYAKDRNEVDEWGPGYLILGTLTTGSGALIGHLFDASKPHLRYDRPAAAKMRFGAFPLYARDIRAVRFVFKF